jgi:hypothetical protein
MASPNCIANFIDPDAPRAATRLRVLLAMADVDDTATRSAAGGALAMLLGSIDEAVAAVLKQEKGVEILLGLCKDESEDVRYRGVVCVRSLVESGEGRERVRESGGVEVVKGALRLTRREEVLGVGVEVLKGLMGEE